MDILIDFGVPILIAFISGLVSYLKAVKKHDTKLKETKIILEKEIEALEKSHANKIKELKTKVELEQKSKEEDIINEFSKELFRKVIQDDRELQKLIKVSEKLKKIQQ